jgi:hypothetical protein
MKLPSAARYRGCAGHRPQRRHPTGLDRRSLARRRLADLSAEDRAEIQLDLSPREIVADYLDNAFPTRAMESYWDEDGNERSRPMVDEAGNPVHSQEALRIKAETLELLARCRRLCPRSMRSSPASAPMPWPRSPAGPAVW